jgi:hypothetical protein
MKIKNMVNQVLRLLNGIAVLGLTPATAAAEIGLNIAYSFWLGFLQVCDSCPWSGRITRLARPGQGLFCIPLSSLPPHCLARAVVLHQFHTSYSLYAGQDVVEVLTKCRVHYLSLGFLPFQAL